MCSGRSRRANSPPWTPGCSVFTRPSSISGNPVTSATSCTLSPASRSAFAVPPVEMRSQSRSTRRVAKSTIPVLSDTEMSARGNVVAGDGWLVGGGESERLLDVLHEALLVPVHQGKCSGIGHGVRTRVEAPATRRDGVHHARVEDMLHLEHARGKRLHRVVR